MFYQIDPWGPERIEYPIATLTALTANINRDSKKRPEPFAVTDFMIQWGRAQEPEEKELPGMSPDHVMKVMESLMREQQVSTMVDAHRRRMAERGRPR